MKQNMIWRAKGLFRGSDARIFWWCAGVVALWRIGLETVNQVVLPYMQYGQATPFVERADGAFKFAAGLHRWIAWDAGWYVHIAQNGYSAVATKVYGNTTLVVGHQPVAFFPLYPVLLRIGHDISRMPFGVVGMAANMLGLSVAAFFLYKLTVAMAYHERATDRNAVSYARFAVLLLLLSPAGVFFASAYADAVLVMLATMAVYFAYQKAFMWAALFAGIATAAKSTAAILAVVIFVMYLYDYRDELRYFWRFIKNHTLRLAAIGGLSVSGLGLYMFYLWHRFGDPFYFSKMEAYWGRRVSPLFLKPIWLNYYSKLLSHHESYRLYVMAIPPAAALFVAYLVVRHKWHYAWLAVLCSLGVLLPIATGTLVSLNRYVMVLTPAMAYAAIYFYGSGSKVIRRAAMAWLWLSASLLFSFTALFLSRHFVG